MGLHPFVSPLIVFRSVLASRSHSALRSASRPGPRCCAMAAGCALIKLAGVGGGGGEEKKPHESNSVHNALLKVKPHTSSMLFQKGWPAVLRSVGSVLDMPFALAHLRALLLNLSRNYKESRAPRASGASRTGRFGSVRFGRFPFPRLETHNAQHLYAEDSPINSFLVNMQVASLGMASLLRTPCGGTATGAPTILYQNGVHTSHSRLCMFVSVI